MKKLILGIVAVFCLQVGFVAYNAAEQAGYLVSKTPNDIQVEPFIRPAFPDTSDMFEVTDDAQYEDLLAEEQDGPDNIRPMVAERRQFSPRLDRKGVKVVSKGQLFQPVVITIPVQQPVEFKFKNEYAAVLTTHPTESYDIAAAEAPRPENKSGLSKAIKKPFEWLKALGSKVKDIR